MNIPVLIEKLKDEAYRARSGEPLVLEAEGATRDEALGNLRQLIDAKLSNGTEMTELAFPEQNNPWLKMAGTLDPNDPMVQEWIEIMKENRKKDDEDPDYL
jgi:predicted RNase H-like HicB family nuclease